MRSVVLFFWNGEFRKESLRHLIVFSPSEKEKKPDEKVPLDRYGIDRSVLYSGSRYLRDDTVWIPSLNTTFFGT